MSVNLRYANVPAKILIQIVCSTRPWGSLGTCTVGIASYNKVVGATLFAFTELGILTRPALGASNNKSARKFVFG